MNEIPKQDWWSRNWKWFLPTGCLLSLVLMAGTVLALMSFVSGMMKSSDANQQALPRAREHPAVVRALGTPIEEGFFVSGAVEVNGASGTADLAIPLAGKKDSGTLFVEARKAAGLWTYSILVVQVDSTSERIDLLDDPE